MLGPRIVQFTLPNLAPLLVIAVQVIFSDALPPSSRRSAPVPITYRLDTWSQYENPEEGTDREGDILESTLWRKTTTRDPRLLWVDGIVRYYLDSSIVNEPAKHAVLEDAMATIEDHTCVKFVRIFPENGSLPKTSWVNITGNQRGCFSDLGRAAAGPSILNLDVKHCFRTRGHALHELLHSLGVYHEHMRPDRDQFINILWNNIKDGDDFNFHMLDTEAATNYDLPYDYDSIMHYSMTAFSKDRSMPTIVPMKDDVDIGQRNRLSTYDVQKLLITYKCENMTEIKAYSEANKSRSDRLEILNLNATAVLPEADSFSEEQNETPLQTIVQPKVDNLLKKSHAISQNGERAVNQPLLLLLLPVGFLGPWNPFFYYYYTQQKPRFSDYYHYYNNYYRPL